jgi:hypothetical protein
VRVYPSHHGLHPSRGLLARRGSPAQTSVPRGFTTVVVVLHLVLVAATLTGIATLFAHEASRTQMAVAQTQLRQLLLASVPVAQAELKSNGIAPRDIRTPIPVEGATLTLHILPPDTAASANVRVRIEASFRHAKAAQVVTFAGEGKLVGAELEVTQGQ